MAVPNRSQDERVVTGLCAGLARELRLSPFIVRAVFVIAALGSGVGLVVYAIGTLVTPSDRSQAEGFWDVLLENLRSIPDELVETWSRLVEATQRWQRRRVDGDWPLRRREALGGSLVILGLLVFLDSLDLFWWLTSWRLLAILIAAAGLYLLTSPSRRP